MHPILYSEWSRSMRRRVAAVTMLMVVAALLAACSLGAGGDSVNGDFDARVAAAVEATVAVAVRETVETQSGVAIQAADSVAAQDVAVAAVLDDAAVETTTIEDLAQVGDNSHEIVDYLLNNGRHFVGNPNADVVIIEFSDFQ